MGEPNHSGDKIPFSLQEPATLSYKDLFNHAQVFSDELVPPRDRQNSFGSQSSSVVHSGNKVDMSAVLATADNNCLDTDSMFREREKQGLEKAKAREGIKERKEREEREEGEEGEKREKKGKAKDTNRGTNMDMSTMSTDPTNPTNPTISNDPNPTNPTISNNPIMSPTSNNPMSPMSNNPTMSSSSPSTSKLPRNTLNPNRQIHVFEASSGDPSEDEDANTAFRYTPTSYDAYDDYNEHFSPVLEYSDHDDTERMDMDTEKDIFSSEILDGIDEYNDYNEEYNGEDEMLFPSPPRSPPRDLDPDKLYGLYDFSGPDPSHCTLSRDEPVFLVNDQDNYWWLIRKLTREERQAHHRLKRKRSVRKNGIVFGPTEYEAVEGESDDEDGKIGFVPAECLETYGERLARLNCFRNEELERIEIALEPPRKKGTKRVAFAGLSLEMSDDEDEVGFDNVPYLGHDIHQHRDDEDRHSEVLSDVYPSEVPLVVKKKRDDTEESFNPYTALKQGFHYEECSWDQKMEEIERGIVSPARRGSVSPATPSASGTPKQDTLEQTPLEIQTPERIEEVQGTPEMTSNTPKGAPEMTSNTPKGALEMTSKSPKGAPEMTSNTPKGALEMTSKSPKGSKETPQGIPYGGIPNQHSPVGIRIFSPGNSMTEGSPPVSALQESPVVEAKGSRNDPVEVSPGREEKDEKDLGAISDQDAKVGASKDEKELREGSKDEKELREGTSDRDVIDTTEDVWEDEYPRDATQEAIEDPIKDTGSGHAPSLDNVTRKSSDTKSMDSRVSDSRVSDGVSNSRASNSKVSDRPPSNHVPSKQKKGNEFDTATAISQAVPSVVSSTPSSGAIPTFASFTPSGTPQLQSRSFFPPQLPPPSPHASIGSYSPDTPKESRGEPTVLRRSVILDRLAKMTSDLEQLQLDYGREDEEPRMNEQNINGDQNINDQRPNDDQKNELQRNDNQNINDNQNTKEVYPDEVQNNEVYPDEVQNTNEEYPDEIKVQNTNEEYPDENEAYPNEVNENKVDNPTHADSSYDVIVVDTLSPQVIEVSSDSSSDRVMEIDNPVKLHMKLPMMASLEEVDKDWEGYKVNDVNDVDDVKWEFRQSMKAEAGGGWENDYSPEVMRFGDGSGQSRTRSDSRGSSIRSIRSPPSKLSREDSSGNTKNVSGETSRNVSGNVSSNVANVAGSSRPLSKSPSISRTSSGHTPYGSNAGSNVGSNVSFGSPNISRELSRKVSRESSRKLVSESSKRELSRESSKRSHLSRESSKRELSRESSKRELSRESSTSKGSPDISRESSSWTLSRESSSSSQESQSSRHVKSPHTPYTKPRARSGSAGAATTREHAERTKIPPSVSEPNIAGVRSGSVYRSSRTTPHTPHTPSIHSLAQSTPLQGSLAELDAEPCEVSQPSSPESPPFIIKTSRIRVMSPFSSAVSSFSKWESNPEIRSEPPSNVRDSLRIREPIRASSLREVRERVREEKKEEKEEKEEVDKAEKEVVNEAENEPEWNQDDWPEKIEMTGFGKLRSPAKTRPAPTLGTPVPFDFKQYQFKNESFDNYSRENFSEGHDTVTPLTSVNSLSATGQTCVQDKRKSKPVHEMFIPILGKFDELAEKLAELDGML